MKMQTSILFCTLLLTELSIIANGKNDNQLDTNKHVSSNTLTQSQSTTFNRFASLMNIGNMACGLVPTAWLCYKKGLPNLTQNPILGINSPTASIGIGLGGISTYILQKNTINDLNTKLKEIAQLPPEQATAKALTYGYKSVASMQNYRDEHQMMSTTTNALAIVGTVFVLQGAMQLITPTE